MSDYQGVIIHPEHGRMLNVTESAKHLGISRRKFRRIASGPDYVQDGVYPFWSQRVLDILPLLDDFSFDEVFGKGKSCGQYIIGPITEGGIRELQNELHRAEHGGRMRTHSCGMEVATYDMSVIEKEKWASTHCDCRSSSPEEETSFVLADYGVNLTFRSSHGAQVYREGILSAINNHLRRLD